MKRYLKQLSVILLVTVLGVTQKGVADEICIDTTSTAFTGDITDSGGPARSFIAEIFGTGFYQNNEDCGFLIEPGGPGSITLSFPPATGFLVFDNDPIVLSDTDELRVYDGRDASGVLLATLTGRISSPADLTAFSGAMFIQFVSNGSGVARGFQGEWEFIPLPPARVEYRFEEGPYNGSAGELTDFSGNNFDATGINFGGVPSDDNDDPAIPGNPGSCDYGDFNGVLDGYFQVNDPGTNSLLDFPTTYSVSVWINPRSFATTASLATIVSKDENFEFHLTRNGEVNWWWGGGERELTSNTRVPLNQWTHITITYESGDQRIYINGVVDATTNSTRAITVNNDPLLIGTDLNFLTRRFNGFIDEVQVFEETLTPDEIAVVINSTHPCDFTGGNTISAFAISVASDASTCSPTAVTIQALDADNAVLDDYAGTIDITTSSGNGDWSINSAPGVLTDNTADDGAASYQFDGTTGEIILNLENQHAETLSVNVNDPVDAVSATSTDVTFRDNAFVVESVDSLGLDVVAGRDHAFRVDFIRRDPTTGSCGVATNYNRSGVKTWVQREPQDPGGVGPTIDSVLPSSPPAIDNFLANFNNGSAFFTLITGDVGRYSLAFLDDSGEFADIDVDVDELDIPGSSPVFTVRPFGFDVQVSANPGAQDEDGPAFIAAGENFTVNVRAVAWDDIAGDDDNDDGAPDGHGDNDPANDADLSDNDTLASFGFERDSFGNLSGATLSLSGTLLAPVGGNDPGLSFDGVDGNIVSSFSGGAGNSASADVYFADVGVIDISAEIVGNNYLLAGVTPSSNTISRSGFVGRFYPATFGASADSVDHSCETFSYMEQPLNINYTVNALNSRAAITQNYEGDFASTVDVTLSAVTSSGAITFTPRVTTGVSVFNWVNGVSTTITPLALNRDIAPDGPFDTIVLGLESLEETRDGVELRDDDLDLDTSLDTNEDSVNLGNTELRYGRLRLQSASGPEVVNLPVNFTTEFWNGSEFVLSADDGCTQIPLSAISFTDTASTTQTADTSLTVTVAASSTTAGFGSVSGGNVEFAGGDAQQFFTAPGAGNTGVITAGVDITALPWLQFDWDNNGVADTLLPDAFFSFGSYRGHDRVIYWEEVLD